MVVGLPTPRLVTHLEGESPGVATARDALRNAGQTGGPSLYLREPSSPDEEADFRLIARGGRYLMARPGDDRSLAEEIEGYSADGAALTIRRLEHVARWTTALRLENPDGAIDPRDVVLSISCDGQLLMGPEIRLEYRPEGERWVKPTIRIRLKNNTSDRTYFSARLLGLAEDFEITAGFFPAGSVQLGPGDEAFALEGKPIPMSIPDSLWKRGVVEFRDVLKLIVCTDPFDARLMEQPPLARPAPSSRAIQEKIKRGTGRRENALNQLMRQVHTRTFEFDEVQYLSDSRTAKVAFTTVRPAVVGRRAQRYGVGVLRAGSCVGGSSRPGRRHGPAQQPPGLLAQFGCGCLASGAARRSVFVTALRAGRHAGSGSGPERPGAGGDPRPRNRNTGDASAAGDCTAAGRR